MSETVPNIPPPPGTNIGNQGDPNANRVDTVPNINDIVNTMTTTNVAQNVVDESLLQVLYSRGAGPFVPMSTLSTFENPLPKRQNQWSNVESRLANQGKRLKIIIIGFLSNDVMNSIINCKTAKEMWNDLILAHEGPSDTMDTKIAELRLKFNAFKALEGEKVNGTYTRLKCLLNDLENNGVNIPQAEVNDTIDKLTKGKNKKEKSNKVKSEKGLIAESFDWDDESVSSEDEGTTKFKAFMEIAEDGPSMGKGDARSGQWVEITMKKRKVLFTDLEGYNAIHHQVSGRHAGGAKNARKANICYTGYLSLIMEHLLQNSYLNYQMVSLKLHYITAITLKPTLEGETALTFYMCSVSAHETEPTQSLIPSTEEVNAEESADKSLFGTSMKQTPKPRAPTATEKLVVTANTTKGVEVSRLAETQDNQPQTAAAEKADKRAKADQLISESPYDTESKIRVVKSFAKINLLEQLSDLELSDMPDDDIRSVSEFENVDSNAEFDHEVSHSDYHKEDLHVDESYASVGLQAITEKFAETQSQLKKKVMKNIKKQFNIAHTVESLRFVTLLKELTNALQSDISKSVESKVSSEMEDVRDALQTQSKHLQSYCQGFQTMQSQLLDITDLLQLAFITNITAKGENEEKNENANPDLYQGEHQAKHGTIPYKQTEKPQGEQPEVAKAEQLKKFIDELFKTTSSIYSPEPPREPTPPKDSEKGKGVVTDESQLLLTSPLEEGGSTQKYIDLNELNSQGIKMTIEESKAQLQEIQRLENLKKAEEESEKIQKETDSSNLQSSGFKVGRTRSKEGQNARGIQQYLSKDRSFADHKHQLYYIRLSIKEPLSDGLGGDADQLSAKHQLAVKGLSECKASESNIRHIQVKDIVNKVKDYLKTYSSAGMDISWHIHHYVSPPSRTTTIARHFSFECILHLFVPSHCCSIYCCSTVPCLIAALSDLIVRENMDKSWMNIAHRLSDPRYQLGVNEFLDFAYRNKQVSSKVPCPCKDCNNYRKHSRPTILKHFMQRGITISYENWIHHGEPYEDLDDSDDDMPISEDSQLMLDSSWRAI
nr:retrovirus-related Pol polyprotein from transposon TNT 1-94 [Tanacetum cinerariifolium]